jgi:hypothetical protein
MIREYNGYHQRGTCKLSNDWRGGADVYMACAFHTVNKPADPIPDAVVEAAAFCFEGAITSPIISAMGAAAAFGGPVGEGVTGMTVLTGCAGGLMLDGLWHLFGVR